MAEVHAAVLCWLFWLTCSCRSQLVANIFYLTLNLYILTTDCRWFSTTTGWLYWGAWHKCLLQCLLLKLMTLECN